jgi:cysteinyl-tRNA synthetase
MSKSLGNVWNVSNLEEKGFRPLALRYFFLNAHYSKQQNFTFSALTSARNSLKNLKKLAIEHKGKEEKFDTSAYEEEFLNAINDDLNMPVALAVTLKMLKENKSNDIYQTLLKFNEILGFDFEEKEDDIPSEIKELASERWEAKANKDFAKSDELRNKILDLGYVVKDTREGYTIEKK